MLQITTASNKHLRTKPTNELKFLKVLSWSSATPPNNTRSVLTSCLSHPKLQSLNSYAISLRKVYLSIIIERHIRVEALLDTGADITLMSTELLEEIQERTKRTNRTLKLQMCELNLQAYSHMGLQLKHVAPTHLTVGPMDLFHPVYVSPLNTYPP